MPDYYVYLKTGNFSNSSSGAISQANTIPLRATSVAISTQRQVPSVEIPLSGLVTGESTTAALDLGMATKNITCRVSVHLSVRQHLMTITVLRIS